MAFGGIGSSPQLFNPRLLPELFPDAQMQVSQASQMGPLATPNARELSNSAINALFNLRRGNYNMLASLPADQQEMLLAKAKESNVKDPGDLAWAQDREILRNNPLYDQFKAAYGHLTSKDLYQVALDERFSQVVQDFAKILGDKKASLNRQARGNFNRVMAALRQPDEDAQRIAQEAEKQAQRIARLAAGLDAEGGDVQAS